MYSGTGLQVSANRMTLIMPLPLPLSEALFEQLLAEAERWELVNFSSLAINKTIQ